MKSEKPKKYKVDIFRMVNSTYGNGKYRVNSTYFNTLEGAACYASRAKKYWTISRFNKKLSIYEPIDRESIKRKMKKALAFA